MKKNVAGQKIGAQMVSATDGSAFTGSVTVSVTLDAGTQATGSVGSGACAHEGNGYHTYAPAQAETNGDLVAFTFTGTGAVPATVQVYPTFPQTGDSFALIGATGSGLTSLASQSSVNTIDDFVDTEVAAILAAVDTEVAAIKAKTDQLTFTAANKVDSTIQAAGDFAQGAADKVWSTAARSLTDKVGFALSAAGIQAIWDALTAALTTANSIGKLLVDNINATISSRATPAQVATELATYDAPTFAELDARTDAIDAALVVIDDFLDTEVAAIKAKTDQMVFTVANRLDSQVKGVDAATIDAAALATSAEESVADTLLNRNIGGGSNVGRLVKDVLRFIRNRKAIAAGTLTVYQEDDATPAWTAAVTTTAGNPISEVDPS